VNGVWMYVMCVSMDWECVVGCEGGCGCGLEVGGEECECM